MKSLLSLTVLLSAVLAACSPEQNAGAEEQAKPSRQTVTSKEHCQLKENTFVFNDELQALKGSGPLFQSSDYVEIRGRSKLNGKAFLVVKSAKWSGLYTQIRLVVGGNACIEGTPAVIEPQPFCAANGKRYEVGEPLKVGDYKLKCSGEGWFDIETGSLIP